MTAQLYWYPEDNEPLRTLDLGRAWRELTRVMTRDQVNAQAADGGRTMATFTSMFACSARAEYLTDAGVVRELQAIEDHLQRNGLVGLAEEDGRTWGGFARTPPSAGATEVKIAENLWSTWSTVETDVGDTVIVQGASPRGRWEEAVIASINAAKLKITFASGLRYDYSDEPYVLVRDAAFWPLLRLQTGALNRPVLTTDHRITWRAALDLEEPPNRVAKAAGRAEPFRGPDYGYSSYSALADELEDEITHTSLPSR